MRNGRGTYYYVPETCPKVEAYCIALADQMLGDLSFHPILGNEEVMKALAGAMREFVPAFVSVAQSYGASEVRRGWQAYMSDAENEISLLEARLEELQNRLDNCE